MKTYTIINAITFLIVCISCSKSKDSSPAEILKSNTWLISKVELGSDSNFTEQVQDACTLDDTWYFKNSGLLEIYKGIKKCDPKDPNIDSGYWELSEDDKYINITSDAITGSLTVNEISDSKFVATLSLGTKGLRYTFAKK